MADGRLPRSGPRDAVEHAKVLLGTLLPHARPSSELHIHTRDFLSREGALGDDREAMQIATALICGFLDCELPAEVSSPAHAWLEAAPLDSAPKA